MTEKVIMAVVVLSTYLLMLAAFFRPQHRKFHVSTMIFVMLFDMGIPVYLYFYRDWYTRLFVHGDIESFLVWMHVILVLSLYILYVFQVQIGRKLLRGDAEASLRIEHRGQGKGILVTRALAILTGALLIEPDPAARG
ncbi:MAG: hypothetical protein HYX62_05575 [Gammaproteobacteria bacterium]|jgi:hypothetical protein|nr:hypothetical protein [Gammaproteobacteria bacterium]